MATNFQCGAVGLTDGSNLPASAAISPNSRVTAARGPLATFADVVQFPGPAPTASVIGNWIVAATRCQIGGIPAITASSTGTAFTVTAGGPTPTGPMQMQAPDTRAAGS